MRNPSPSLWDMFMTATDVKTPWRIYRKGKKLCNDYGKTNNSDFGNEVDNAEVISVYNRKGYVQVYIR